MQIHTFPLNCTFSEKCATFVALWPVPIMLRAEHTRTSRFASFVKIKCNLWGCERDFLLQLFKLFFVAFFFVVPRSRALVTKAERSIDEFWIFIDNLITIMKQQHETTDFGYLGNSSPARPDEIQLKFPMWTNTEKVFNFYWTQPIIIQPVEVCCRPSTTPAVIFIVIWW